jgi:bacterioferritin (cytochrome b1)
MADSREQLIEMLNRALALEYAVIIQYRTHAELISGTGSEEIISRLREIADDETDHTARFRSMISDYLDSDPAMDVSDRHTARDRNEIFAVNIHDEKFALDFYKQIQRFIVDHKSDFPYEYERLEHEMRHIIMDEEEHVSELKQLMGSRQVAETFA